jgi:hypothetical protein
MLDKANNAGCWLKKITDILRGQKLYTTSLGKKKRPSSNLNVELWKIV